MIPEATALGSTLSRRCVAPQYLQTCTCTNVFGSIVFTSSPNAFQNISNRVAVPKLLLPRQVKCRVQLALPRQLHCARKHA